MNEQEEGWEPAGYVRCDDDPQFGKCAHCGAKIAVYGNDKTDALRHESECPGR